MIIHSNQVYTATGVKPAYLQVDKGRIQAILPPHADYPRNHRYSQSRSSRISL